MPVERDMVGRGERETYDTTHKRGTEKKNKERGTHFARAEDTPVRSLGICTQRHCLPQAA